MNWISNNIREFSYLFLAWFFICFLSGLEIVMFQIFRPDQVKFVMALPLIRLLSGTMGIIGVLMPGYKILKDIKGTARIIGFGLIGLLFALVYVVVFVGTYQWYYLEVTMEGLLLGIVEILLDSLHHIGAYYFFLLGILLINDYFQEKVEALVKTEKVERELSQAKFSTLKSQLQPHFLFNAINGVIAIMNEKKDTAQKMLVNLSDLLRTSLDIDFSKKIKVSEEIEILNLYLDIEKRRFEHQLDLEINMEEQAEKQQILPFTLQPVVENSIKHGFAKGIKRLHIKIEVYVEKDKLCLVVSNNGKKLTNSIEGIGLKNLRARLENEYKDKFCLELLQDENFVISKIAIDL